VVEYHDDMISPKTWPYDFVFGSECSNEYVFNATARKLISGALDGYNTVLFMYGQTSSGTVSILDPLS
jgi:kinesin family member 11